MPLKTKQKEPSTNRRPLVKPDTELLVQRGIPHKGQRSHCAIVCLAFGARHQTIGWGAIVWWLARAPTMPQVGGSIPSVGVYWYTNI